MKKLIQIILILIIIVCLGMILHKTYQYYNDEKDYSIIREYKNDIGEGVDNNDLIDEDRLVEINPDYKLWINIEGTKVDYPIVQGEDNEFYLTHKFSREKSPAGTLFVDCNNDIENDENIVIYGHNMRNGSMFNNLTKFKEEIFGKGKYISIIKNNKEYIYEIFSVYVEPVNNEEIKMSIGEKNEYDDYLKRLKNNSLYEFDVELDRDSKIITLITCSYEYKDARIIVNGIYR